MAETPLRSMRLTDKYWIALEAYARLRGWRTSKGDGDRTRAMVALMEERIPDKCWPKESELEGQLSIL